MADDMGMDEAASQRADAGAEQAEGDSTMKVERDSAGDEVPSQGGVTEASAGISPENHPDSSAAAEGNEDGEKRPLRHLFPFLFAVSYDLRLCSEARHRRLCFVENLPAVVEAHAVLPHSAHLLVFVSLSS
jgi:hypothetical protein